MQVHLPTDLPQIRVDALRLGQVLINLLRNARQASSEARDIEALALHLLARSATRLRRAPLELAPKTLSRLRQHRWPGNVRELANVIERAVILCDGPRVLPEHLLLTPETAGESELDGTLKQIEQRAIARALRHHDGHRQKAAEALGISVRGLYGKIKEYGIES